MKENISIDGAITAPLAVKIWPDPHIRSQRMGEGIQKLL